MTVLDLTVSLLKYSSDPTTSSKSYVITIEFNNNLNPSVVHITKGVTRHDATMATKVEKCSRSSLKIQYNWVRQ